MRDEEREELQTLRELAKAVDDLLGDFPPLQRYRRDRSGTVGFTPRTLSLYRYTWRLLNVWKKNRKDGG
jgi:hypothetical protein